MEKIELSKELYKKLITNRLTVQYEMRYGGFEMKMVDYVKMYHPEFYNTIFGIIERLGDITETRGHSYELDRLKDRIYGLVNL